jgi:hypothetical protein
MFDDQAFSMSPSELPFVSPIQRLLLQVADSCLRRDEDALCSARFDVMVGVEIRTHLVTPVAHVYLLKLACDALTQVKLGGPAPSKACEPILDNVFGSVSEVIPLEPKNAPLPIDVTFAGIFTTCNEPLPANALLGMVVIPLPKLTDVS